jgi:predicted GNAT family N-acyltransferase
MIIRQANSNDIDALMLLFEEARATIATLGIDQWQNGYPSRSVVNEDIVKERSFVVEIEDRIVGTFVIITDGEPTYDRIYDGAWLTKDSQSYTAIHRVAVSVTRRGSGISTAIIHHAAKIAAFLHRSSLRIDTHKGNLVMRRMLEKHGFVHCGSIYLEGGDHRVAYETLTNEVIL